uniref:Uncharacterized protein MANES_12G056400 n=1 Tax=Rhizophora mucronata TaxID=61149 RepID=A0A2P2MBX8_RHIMU
MPCQSLKTFLQILSCKRRGIKARCLPIFWRENTKPFHLHHKQMNKPCTYTYKTRKNKVT